MTMKFSYLDRVVDTMNDVNIRLKIINWLYSIRIKVMNHIDLYHYSKICIVLICIL